MLNIRKVSRTYYILLLKALSITEKRNRLTQMCQTSLTVTVLYKYQLVAIADPVEVLFELTVIYFFLNRKQRGRPSLLKFY
jgi:hypothetical protein